MDDKNPTDPNETPTPVPPRESSEDVQQFSGWMTEYGRPALIGLAVAVVALLAISIWRNQKAEQAAAAVQALFQRRSPEELRQMAEADPEAPTAPMALASAAAEFYAQNRYDEALSAYQGFLGRYPAHMLAPDAQIGVAASLEALDDFEAAAAGYEAFAAGFAASPLRPQAVMGAARCREQLGQFDQARALYEDFIAGNPDSSWLPQAESGLLFLKKAERAKNAPAPAAPAEAAPVATEAAAPAVAEAAPAAMEEAAPAIEEKQAAPDESKPQKKKKSSKKKKEIPAKETSGGAPADE